MVLTLILAALAVWRLTRLITADRITARPRDWLIRRNEAGHLAYLIECPWCVSPYIAIPVVIAAVYAPDNRAVLTVLAVLAFSAVAGAAATAEKRVDAATELDEWRALQIRREGGWGA